VPEILLARELSVQWFRKRTYNLPLTCLNKPSRQQTTLELVSPRLLELLIGRHNATTINGLDEPDRGVDDHVRNDTSNQTVGIRVGERHNSQRNENEKGVSDVFPIDVLGSGSHHCTDDD
jgi:hypothetical protein